MSRERVLVAMSGGVDSSMACAILKEQGYEVIGATMKIWPRAYCARERRKACCSLQDIEDAKKVCAVLGIRHYVFNFEKAFREEVIDYFTQMYLSGRTPNPCIICNEKIKFGTFLKRAKELECDFIATGHYARIERNGSCRLRESIDKKKDQSYVLFSLSPSQLQNALLPIGGLSKDNVKAMAKKLGLSVYEKAESQEICFVPGNSYSDFIKEYSRIGPLKGSIIDSGGKILGFHSGFWNFTIGQRRGLAVSHKKPLYVIDIDSKKNIVVVGDSSEVRKRRFIVKDINWLYRDINDSFEAHVKIRYAHKKARAFLRKIPGSNVEVEFDVNQEAITPGQAAVFYNGEYVLGGGWIERVLN
jgi:tRNA-specific 2-thiouridylase